MEALTLYSFSMENWRRPREEVNALMHLYAEYLVRERPLVMDNNIRLRHLGRREGLPESVLAALDDTVEACRQACTGMTLSLALNYGSRIEILDAIRDIAAQAAGGQIRPDQIDEDTVSNALDTAGLPDPDLVIRTAGEMRLSNFLLWQISYAEYLPLAIYCPDLTP